MEIPKGALKTSMIAAQNGLSTTPKPGRDCQTHGATATFWNSARRRSASVEIRDGSGREGEALMLIYH